MKFKEASVDDKELYGEPIRSNSLNEERVAGIKSEKEGDVGAGGAVLGGTGIAEVALPVEVHLKALKETERAAAEYSVRRAGRAAAGSSVPLGGPADPPDDGATSEMQAMLPMSFASGPSSRKRGPDMLVRQPAPKAARANIPAPGDWSLHDISSLAIPRGLSVPPSNGGGAADAGGPMGGGVVLAELLAAHEGLDLDRQQEERAEGGDRAAREADANG